MANPTAPPFEVELVDRAPCSYVFLRHEGSPDKLGASWAKFMSWAGRRGLLRPGAEVFGLVYDDPEAVEPEAWRYDLCIAGEDIPTSDEVQSGLLAGGRFARVQYRGPISSRGGAYDFLLGAWPAATNVALLDGPIIETITTSPLGIVFRRYSVGIHVRIHPATAL